MTDMTCLAVGDRVVYRDDAGGVHESTVQWVDGTAAAGVADDMIWHHQPRTHHHHHQHL